MITRQTIQDQIASLEAQQADAKLVIDRAEGALQVMRSWLGKMEKEDEEWRAKCWAETNGETPAEPAVK